MNNLPHLQTSDDTPSSEQYHGEYHSGYPQGEGLRGFTTTSHSQDYLGEGQHDAIDQYDPSTPLAGGMVASMPYGQSYIESHYQAQHVNDLTDQMSHNYDPTSRMRSSTFPSYAPSAYASPGQYATTSAASSSWGYASATSSSDAWHSRALQMPSYGSYPSESLAGYPTTSGYASDEYSYMPALTPRPQSTSGSERRIHRYSPVPHRAIPDISQRRSYPSLHESKLADVPHPPRSPDEFIYTTSPASDADSPVNKYSKSVTEQPAAPSLSSGLPSTQPLYTHRDQVQFFEDALLNCPMSSEAGPFIPQLMYKPHTTSDRRRYVEEVDLDAPIYFWVTNPTECGISLSDALHSRLKRLQNKDQRVFEGRGPSVSIRIEWPGYRQWSRQIPTKDFRSPPGPITRAKLAKNVAKCVQRFIADRANHPETGSDPHFRLGTQPGQIKLEDLILVSMHHVSMGSWQPHLRLRRPLPDAFTSAAPART